MNNLENNKLIAEFMGLPKEVFNSGNLNYYFKEFSSGTWYEEQELSYNISWDWLNPVVEKIESMGYPNKTIGVTSTFYNGTTEVKIWNDMFLGKTKIEATYKAVVEFIKWYNENK